MIATIVHYGQQASLNLMAAKLRTCLAALGILVGTAAIVALIYCSQLATEKALAQFKALGTDLLAMSVFQQEPNQSNGGEKEVSLQDWRALTTRIPDVLQIAPYNTTYQQVSFQGKNVSATIIGADDSLADTMRIKLEKGNFVSCLATFERLCVIGNALALELKQISADNLLGKRLRIGNALYTIIGIAAPWKGNDFFNADINQAVLIPIAGMVLVNKDIKINNAILRLKPDSNIDVVIEQIKHAIQTQSPNMSLFVRSAKQIISSMKTQGEIFTLLLAVIGGISLLVGGIGVMNVMLISVSERKKEIGIRKAIGATNREIQSLFLVESIILSLLSGLLGVIVGLLFTVGVAYFSQWPFAVYMTPLWVGFAVSTATGVFFGFYPAKRAAKLEPMASLRGE